MSTSMFLLQASAGIVEALRSVPSLAYWAGGIILLPILWWAAVRYIPHNSVGIVEKLWSADGSVNEGNIIALNNEAGYQAEVLRGGMHLGLWRWQYRIHRMPLATIPQGKIGYVYARDGEPLLPTQTLGRVAPCNNFQDARAFLIGATASRCIEDDLAS